MEHDLKQYAIYRDGIYLGNTTDTFYLDNPVAQCDYYVTAIDIHDNERVASNTWNTGPLGITGKPSDLWPTYFNLGGASPNPASSNTIINYQLPKQAQVCIKVYNLSGQLVKEIINKTQEPGYYQANWDGKDNSGKKVSAGVYLYRMTARLRQGSDGQAGEFTATKKMVVIR